MKLAKPDKTLQFIKKGVWVYFLLLIFEGALRKWFLPGLATPLLVIRDPIALWLIITAWSHQKLRANPYMTSVVLIGILSIFTAVVVGHGNLLVALYGARILLLQFPLIFVIGSCFNRADIVKLGIVTLWITIPMTILIAIQFYSPQSAWVNRGVGGDMSGAGFSGAMGYFRPPATFSFTNGTGLFFNFAACFVFYFWIANEKVNKLLLIGATIGILASIPLSISRTLFFQVILSLLFTLIAVSRKPKFLGRFVLIGAILLLAVIALSQLSFFQTSVEAFTQRFTSANETEGGLVEGVLIDRFLGGLISAFSSSSKWPLLGYGIGMGTNVGSQLLRGELLFLIAETEWLRIVGELGPILGIALIILRVRLALKIALACYSNLKRGYMLPWLLLSYGILLLMQGGWAQPTALGFCTLTSGLMIASLNNTGKAHQ
ncbi:hypothetical protein EXU85_08620 [Spirosoma sp. KCTC 42546]|nr:hypothetical protein EXU85_08620 [Spirosoma sp. KCTC 42546]